MLLFTLILKSLHLTFAINRLIDYYMYDKCLLDGFPCTLILYSVHSRALHFRMENIENIVAEQSNLMIKKKPTVENYNQEE